MALYRAELGKDTPLTDQAKAIEAAGKKKDPPPDYSAANAELESALLQKVPVTDSDLENLGKRRARAIQDVLLLGTDSTPPGSLSSAAHPKPLPRRTKFASSWH